VPFGIHATVVNPGFFRTELLTEQSTDYAEPAIADYDARRGPLVDYWKSQNGKQPGDPQGPRPARAGSRDTAHSPRCAPPPDAKDRSHCALLGRMPPVDPFRAQSESRSGPQSGVQSRSRCAPPPGNSGVGRVRRANAGEHIRISLAGADLSLANLSRANLSGAGLREADMRHTDLSGANLTGAIFGGAHLGGATLNGAILAYALVGHFAFARHQTTWI
jgi:hypothetical protein